MKSCVVEEFRFVNKTRRGPAVAPCFSETERSGPKSSIEKSGIDLNFRPGGTNIFILKINYHSQYTSLAYICHILQAFVNEIWFFMNFQAPEKRVARDAPTTNQKPAFWSCDRLYPLRARSVSLTALINSFVCHGLAGLPVTPSNLAFLENLGDNEYHLLLQKLLLIKFHRLIAERKKDRTR